MILFGILRIFLFPVLLLLRFYFVIVSLLSCLKMFSLFHLTASFCFYSSCILIVTSFYKNLFFKVLEHIHYDYFEVLVFCIFWVSFWSAGILSIKDPHGHSSLACRFSLSLIFSILIFPNLPLILYNKPFSQSTTMLWGLHLFVWILGPLRSFLLTVSAFPSSSFPVLCVNFFHRSTFTRKPKTTLKWEEEDGCYHLSSQPLTHSILTLSFIATWLQKHLCHPHTPQ